MLFVRGVLKLNAGECLAEGDPNAVVLLGGVMDMHFRDNYNAALLVGNQLERRGKKDIHRYESNRVVLKGEEVTLLDDQENSHRRVHRTRCRVRRRRQQRRPRLRRDLHHADSLGARTTRSPLPRRRQGVR